jgi:hypothetical protein
MGYNAMFLGEMKERIYVKDVARQHRDFLRIARKGAGFTQQRPLACKKFGAE